MPVSPPDSADAPAGAPDEGKMRMFRKNSSAPTASDSTRLPEPQAESAAVVIRPARPARNPEQLPLARAEQGRASRSPSAAALVRDPRAYPTSPPRPEGAVKRTYVIEPEVDPGNRTPLSLRSSSMRTSLSPSQRAQRAREDDRRG